MTAIVLALAQICASEAGLRTDTADCAAIYHVLEVRSEAIGVRWITAAHSYSTRVFDRSRTHRRYLAHMTLDGRRPEGWPAAHSWARYRPRWLALVELARRIVAGEVPNPCPGARHWGMRTGEEGRRPIEVWGWHEATCTGPTRNAFWEPPHRRVR